MVTEDSFSHKCCIRCIHWYYEFCYRYPPTPFWNKDTGSNHYAKYPVVAPANWCGEWRGVTQRTLQERIDWITQVRECENDNRD